MSGRQFGEVEMVATELTALEALGVAVRREMDVALAYRDLTARCSNALARERFRLLEQEARHHETLLRREHARLAPGVEFVVPASPVVPAPAAGPPAACEGLRGALRFALDAAQRAREFYLDAASSVTDLTGQAMLRYLADVHARHHMELEAEYDLVLRYPHAYDDPQAPWRPESRPTR